jgi:hypothetical protein
MTENLPGSAATPKALSLSRPWTTLVMRGHKNIENRTWETRHRGPLLIHGAQSWDGHTARALAEQILDGSAVAFAELEHLKALHPTGILGVADVVDCCTSALSSDPCDCGPWAMPGQAHWKLANVRPFPEPIPCRGALGLWTPPVDVLERIPMPAVRA